MLTHARPVLVHQPMLSKNFYAAARSESRSWAIDANKSISVETFQVRRFSISCVRPIYRLASNTVSAKFCLSRWPRAADPGPRAHPPSFPDSLYLTRVSRPRSGYTVFYSWAAILHL
jgi:hypothetical protein